MKTLEEKLLQKRQYRDLEEITIGAEKNNCFNSDFYIEGYAATFDRYVLMDGENPIYEQFDRKVFENADMSDVIFQLNHEGTVHARLSNNTLALEIDDHGLKVKADLSKSQDARNLHEAIKNKLITKMSWGFRVGEYDFNEETRTIYHTSIKKIFDVSAVSIPANNGTEISARSLIDGEIEKLQAERLKHERKLLELKLKIELNK